MKIKELIYKTPEMTEEKLLKIMDDNLFLLSKDKPLIYRIHELHKDMELIKAFLQEYDLIQDKRSYLTKSQRDHVIGFVGVCMFEMTKGKDETGH